MPTGPVTARVIDSHTEGEPTRVVVEGGPELGSGSFQERLEIFRRDYDDFRAGVCCEPRGSEVVVGAMLCAPTDASCAAGVIFFNDVGYLGMCGHGTIGVVRTLAHLGRIEPGSHRIETPVGIVEAELLPDGAVRVRNVESYRYRAAVSVDVPGNGTLVGDIAWGGNWFFLIGDHSYDLSLENRYELVRATHAIRQALAQAGITGKDGAVIDHIELFGEPVHAENSSRNFVLCPGASFDRSPCGTGTSAKMACLYADGKLSDGDKWRQEGILGTHFIGTIEAHGESVLPTIEGRAWISAESTLIFDPSDPFRGGIGF
ncbi:proline racemase family protein [Silvibacterium acidisoli]|uniref:proline racemase family protein n=1 Tax=Acidobacteriaceae bacterium ZG23-2 TaxID=2883246 RepID=UPI00406C0775